MAEKKKDKKYKLEIKDVLESIDRRDKNFYSNLSDEDKKGFVPFTALRFCSSVSGSKDITDYHLLATNEINKHFFELTSHPDLQWKLLTVVGLGTKQYHNWIGPMKRSKTSSMISELVRQIYPWWTDDEIDTYIRINSVDYFVDLAEQYNYDKKQIDQIKKELNEKG
ncbi:MAG: hypothetical protein WC284_08420 [Candidimonas sp.]